MSITRGPRCRRELWRSHQPRFRLILGGAPPRRHQGRAGHTQAVSSQPDRDILCLSRRSWLRLQAVCSGRVLRYSPCDESSIPDRPHLQHAAHLLQNAVSSHPESMCLCNWTAGPRTWQFRYLQSSYEWTVQGVNTEQHPTSKLQKPAWRRLDIWMHES